MTGPMSHVVVRSGALAVMGIAVVAGAWPVAAMVLVGTTATILMARLRVRQPGAGIAAGPLAWIDESGLGRRWKTAFADGDGGAEIRRTGWRGWAQRRWRELQVASSAIARATPFLIIGGLGAMLRGQAFLIALLVASYPFLEMGRYYEAKRRRAHTSTQ